MEYNPLANIFCKMESASQQQEKHAKFELKTPKGTKDYGPAEMAIRENVINTIVRVFKKHGGVAIDTPVFELKEILTGKYGEDSKLIYDLQDQGGELCSLRYDLTVPFARFLAMNRDIKNIKRYQIAKVYRRDQPAMTKGRFREFYQCDFDIAGVFEPMVPDAEVLKIMSESLRDLQIGNFIIKINNRKLLDGIFEVCGVPEEKFRCISSAVDKLDKMAWKEVKSEMTNEKGLDEAIADKIGEFISLKGKKDLIIKLKENSGLMANQKAKDGLNELDLLFEFLEAFGIVDLIQFDLSLARGLDYYTGLIMEAILTDGEVGSIAGGGRYDNLVGMFSPKNQIPCVGFSIGIERVFSVLEARMAKEASRLRSTSIDVYVAASGDSLLLERMKFCRDLWAAGLNAEFSYKRKPKYLDQVSHCEKQKIPLMVILGPTELEKGCVLVKCGTDSQDRGTSVEVKELIDHLKNKLKLQ